MTDEEINKIAMRVFELQKKYGIKSTNGRCSIADITSKYHKQLYDKFGATGQIETAVRIVAIYSIGYRYINQIPEDKFEYCRNYAEKLYKEILKDDLKE